MQSLTAILHKSSAIQKLCHTYQVSSQDLIDCQDTFAVDTETLVQVTISIASDKVWISKHLLAHLMISIASDKECEYQRTYFHMSQFLSHQTQSVEIKTTLVHGMISIASDTKCEYQNT